MTTVIVMILVMKITILRDRFLRHFETEHHHGRQCLGSECTIMEHEGGGGGSYDRTEVTRRKPTGF